MSNHSWGAELSRQLGDITKDGVSEILFSLSPSPLQAYLIESSASAAAAQVQQAFNQALESAIQIQNMAMTVDGMQDVLLLQAQQQQGQQAARQQSAAQMGHMQPELLLLKTRQLQISQQHPGQSASPFHQGGPLGLSPAPSVGASGASSGLRYMRQDSADTMVPASPGLMGPSSKDISMPATSSDGTNSILGDLLYHYSNDSTTLGPLSRAAGANGNANTRLFRSSTGDLPRRGGGGLLGAGNGNNGLGMGANEQQHEMLMRSRTDLSAASVGPGSTNSMGAYDGSNTPDLGSLFGSSVGAQQHLNGGSNLFLPANLLQAGGMGLWPQQQQQQQQQQFHSGQSWLTPQQQLLLGPAGAAAFGPLSAQASPATIVEDISQLPPRFSVLPPMAQQRIVKLCIDNPIITVKDFDKKVVDKMSTLVENYGAPECVAMLDELEHRMRTKHAVMKNGPGYLDVAVSSHLDMLRAQGKATTNTTVTNMQEYAQTTLGGGLYEELNAALEISRWLKWDHLDQGIIHMIKKLPTNVASEKLQELSCHSFKNVNNTKGCIMSILNSKPNQPGVVSQP